MWEWLPYLMVIMELRLVRWLPSFFWITSCSMFIFFSMVYTPWCSENLLGNWHIGKLLFLTTYSICTRMTNPTTERGMSFFSDAIFFIYDMIFWMIQAWFQGNQTCSLMITCSSCWTSPAILDRSFHMEILKESLTRAVHDIDLTFFKEGLMFHLHSSIL